MMHRTPGRPGAAFWFAVAGLALVLVAAVVAALWALHGLNVI